MKAFTVLLMATTLMMGAEKSAEAVKAAEKTWATATVADDEAALNKVLANDLTYTHSTGDTDNKTVFMSNLKSGARKYLKIDHEKMDVRLYGNTAVLTADAQIATSMNGGAPAPAHLHWLHVYIFEGGHWQLVAHQSLRLPH